MRDRVISRCITLIVILFIAHFVQAEDLGDMLSEYIPGNTAYDSAWSVFVGGDFFVEQGASELEGRVFVRNDLTISIPAGSGYNVGIAVGAGVYPPDGSEALVVGGDLLGSGKLIMSDYRARVENTVASGIILQDLEILYTGGVDFDFEVSWVPVNFLGFESGDTILINMNKVGSSDEFLLTPSSFTFNSEF